MERSEALKLCKFYKGEEECPFDYSDYKSTWWSIEQTWVKWDCTTPIDEDGNVLEFIVDFPDELSYIEIPLSLKGTMYNQHLHWGNTPESFPDVLLSYIKA